MKRLGLWILLLASLVQCQSATQPKIERMVLKNGIPVLFVALPEIPTASVGILIKGGVAKLHPGEDGLELLTLQTVFAGSESLGYPQFEQQLAAWGIDLNINAQNDYSLITLHALDKYLAKAIQMAGDAFLHPEFSSQAFERYRREMLAAARRRQANPNNRVWDLVNSVFYEGHPYHVRADGTVESLQRITLDSVRTYWKSLLKSGAFLIGVTGHFHRDSVWNWLNQTFGEIPKVAYSDPKVPPLQPRDTLVTDTLPLQTAYLAGKFPGPSLRDPDFPATLLGLSVLDDRLWDTLRTQYGLTYATGSGLSMRRANYGYIYFSSAQPEEAFSLLKREIENLKSHPLRDEDLRRAKNLWQTRTFLRQESTAGLVGNLLLFEYLGYRAEQFYQLPYALEQLTPTQVQKAVRKYLQQVTYGFLVPKGNPG